MGLSPALTDAVLGARDIHVVTYTIGVVTIGGAIETLTSEVAGIRLVTA